ncbi:MAG: LamG domain-containing protein [Sedimentisphaerales bacterium]|nr:LamG domain-containing protein [Sedimentisphaerales bacterium]
MCRKPVFLVLVCLLGLAPMASADLVGWWKFDDAMGTVATDSSGNGYDGTVVNATWEAGQFGVALSFDGSAYVDVPPEAWSTIETQATATFWAYGDPDAQPQANFILGAFQDPAVNDSRVMSAHVPWSNGTVYFDTGGSTTDTYDRINLAADVGDYEGTWTHWAFVKNADTGDQQIYLNGALWHSGTGMTRPMTGVTAFTIGCKPGPSNYYVGLIDDFRLYDTALTEQDLQSIIEGSDTQYLPAIGLEPADGAMIESTVQTLKWKAGDAATSHAVYIGESFDDVNDALVDPITVTDDSLMVGAAPPYATGLTPGQTYYWRVDAVSETHPDSPWKGAVRSFWVRPATAWDPAPADAVEFVDVDSQLTWEPGLGALFHTVYFGESFDEVNDAVAGGFMIASATFDPSPLELDKTYYWRVDEFAMAGTIKGDVWSFRTMPEIPVSDPNLALWFKLDESQGSRAVDWSGHENHGAITGTPLWTQDGYDWAALQLTGANYMQVQNNAEMKLLSSNAYTVGLFIKLENTDQQALLYHGLGCSTWASWFLGVAGGEPDTDVVPNNFVFGVREVGGAAFTGVSAPAKANAWVHVAVTYDGSMLRLYIDGQEMNSAAVPLPWDSDENLYIGADPGCGGRVYTTAVMDDVRIYNRALSVEEIEQIVRVDLSLAWDPQPGRGTIVDVRDASSLSWKAGDAAVSHDVYFGTDRDAVAAADKDAPEFQGNQPGMSFPLAGRVEFGGGDYFWRIDEVEADETVHAGNIWNFTVPDYLIVEDFESYSNEVGSRAFEKWIDGIGFTLPEPGNPGNGTGSAVGHDIWSVDSPYLDGTIMETTNVRGGALAMPIYYDNTLAPAVSEADRTFTPGQNWTAEGVTTLVLHVRGQADNTGDLYVKINGVKVPYGGDIADGGWVPWEIDLASVGVSLTNVTTLTIGIEGGGTGVIFVDDIILTRP